MKTTNRILIFLISISILFSYGLTSMEPDFKLLSETNAATINSITAPTDVKTENEDLPHPYSFPDDGIPALMYHSISTDPKNTLCVSEKQFAEEMEWLKNNNYHCISLDQLYQALVNHGPLPDKPVMIIFDDGYANNYKTACPILQKNGFTGVFFIVTNYVCPNRIDWDQLKDLLGHGNSIGSHSVHHYDMNKLTYEQQKLELRQSKQILEDHLGICITAFCYPFGQYNEAIMALLPESGYTLAFTTSPGKVHFGDNPFALKRVPILGGMSADSFIKQIS